MSVLKTPLIKILLLLVSLSVWSEMVNAKTIYVNDQIRVGIRPDPNNDAAPLTVVSTGDKLEQLDSDSGYVLVRTKDGVEGWIKEIYTTSQVPAIVELNTLRASSGGNVEKLRELNKQIQMVESTNKVLVDELEEIKNERNRYHTQIMAMTSGQVSGNSWIFWLVCLVLFTVASFISGMYWYRNQAMKKLGGLRIYF